VAFVSAHAEEIEEPVCVILTGGNIAWEDFVSLVQSEPEA
jgi:hypothetical protein